MCSLDEAKRNPGFYIAPHFAALHAGYARYARFFQGTSTISSIQLKTSRTRIFTKLRQNGVMPFQN
jgi:hypothetical protein